MKLWIILICFILSFIGPISQAKQPNKPPTSSQCLPNQSCWPSLAQWDELNKLVNGHLIKGENPLLPCTQNSKTTLCLNVLESLKNPFFLETLPGSTQSIGWFGAWNSSVSSYVVAVTNAQEIATAVTFARKHHIKLVVKGTGHDYLGRSNAPDSLLIWTHNMRKVTMQDHFIPQGCPATEQGVSAVTAQAGTRWLEAYKEVVVNHGLYVQGGGCTSVGVAGGFIQGGGFGSFSKKFGTGAAGILEAEVITADGSILIANACQNKDLFWALKGGGGGTYGIVSKITLRTHALPPIFGAVSATIKAKSDTDYKTLIDYFISFYRMRLHNEHWGEQVIFSPNNEMQLSLVFQGMNQVEAAGLWQSFTEWLAKRPNQYEYTLNTLALPARQFWDVDYLNKNLPTYIIQNKRKDAPAGEFWWVGNQSEVSIYLTHYESGYIPFSLFEEPNSNRLSKALFDASRLTRLSLHLNKGLSGASDDAISRQKYTSMSPAVLNAAALVTISGGQQYAYPNITGHKPNLIEAQTSAYKAKKAMELIYQLSPDAGTYANEADYFLDNWRVALWGSNYDKLLAIKHKYDPEHLFNCHHCVGSEDP